MLNIDVDKISMLNFLVLLSFLFSSCSADSSIIDSIVLVCKDKVYYLESNEGSVNVQFNASNRWLAKTNDGIGWIKISPSIGDAGNVNMEVSVKENDVPQDRNAFIVISCGISSDTILIKQKSKDFLKLSTHEINVPANGGTFNIEIKSNVDILSKMDKDEQSWLSCSSKINETGTKELVITVMPNDDVECRQGIINIFGGNLQDLLTINQEGAEIKEVTITSPGTLRDIIGGKDILNSMVALKIHGYLNGYDIEDIRNIPSLTYLDIKDVSLVPGGVYMGNNHVKENEIDDWMFCKLEKLRTIILPSNVENIGFHAFYGCKKLENCILPKELKSIGYASFIDCISLKDIQFPEKLVSIGYNSFTNCSSLKEIILPNSITYLGTSAFSRCTNLNKIILGNNLNKIDTYAFWGDCNISTIYMNTIPNDNTVFATNIFDEKLYTTTVLYIPKGSTMKFTHTPFENFINIMEF